MDLKAIRDSIDSIDSKLLDLFLERMRLSEQVALYKRENSLPVLNKAREREILARVAEQSGDMEMYTHQLFSTLFELSKARQNELNSESTELAAKINNALLPAEETFPHSGTIACQGVEGGNSQAACDRLLTRGSIVYVKTFEAVCNAVESGLCKYGVLPIENSSAGSVRGVYELLRKRNFSIIRSASLCIRHVLLGKKGAKLSDITEIHSHTQALSQCDRFLSKSGIKTVPCANTAQAAQLVSLGSGKNVAAIASPACAELYGLEIIADDIMDSENNYTRFVCITKEPRIYAGADRISLILACDNKPGALYNILSKLSARGINMSKLESCPVTGSDFEFIFFLEIDASVREPGVISMLCELENECSDFSFLGCYSEV